MKRISLALALLPTLSGCEKFQLFKDTMAGLTNPLVAEGIILGVEPAESEELDLSGTQYQGTAATVWLADAKEADELENAPVEGAIVDVENVAATEMGDGVYVIEPGPLTYEDNADWSVNAQIEEDLATATVTLVPPADLEVPEEHGQGEALAVDLTGMGYHTALVAVVDIATGELTYSNEPQDIGEFYDFTHGADEAGVIEIPGTAFPGQSLYATGIAGMVHTTSDDFEDMNTLLSTFMSGKMRFYPVSTITIPED